MSRLPEQLSTKTGEAQCNLVQLQDVISLLEEYGGFAWASFSCRGAQAYSPHPIQLGFLHTIYGALLGNRNWALKTTFLFPSHMLLSAYSYMR